MPPISRPKSVCVCVCVWGGGGGGGILRSMQDLARHNPVWLPIAAASCIEIMHTILIPQLHTKECAIASQLGAQDNYG